MFRDRETSKTRAALRGPSGETPECYPAASCSTVIPSPGGVFTRRARRRSSYRFARQFGTELQRTFQKLCETAAMRDITQQSQRQTREQSPQCRPDSASYCGRTHPPRDFEAPAGLGFSRRPRRGARASANFISMFREVQQWNSELRHYRADHARRSSV